MIFVFYILSFSWIRKYKKPENNIVYLQTQTWLQTHVTTFNVNLQRNALKEDAFILVGK